MCVVKESGVRSGIAIHIVENRIFFGTSVTLQKLCVKTSHNLNDFTDKRERERDCIIKSRRLK